MRNAACLHELFEVEVAEIGSQRHHRLASLANRRNEGRRDCSRTGSSHARKRVAGFAQCEYGADQADALDTSAFEHEVGHEPLFTLGIGPKVDLSQVSDCGFELLLKELRPPIAERTCIVDDHIGPLDWLLLRNLSHCFPL